MKTPIRIIAAAAICLAAQSSFARETTTIGTPDCGQWLTEKTPIRKIWLAGFLSGMNVFHMATSNRDPLDGLSSMDQAYAWMDSYCGKNPLNNIGHGGLDLFIELIERSKNTKARK